MSVHKKLMQARLALQGKKLQKTGKNSFAGYQYFELGDFLPTVQEIFNDVGLCGVVSFTSDIASLCIVDTDDGASITITSPFGSASLKGAHEIQNIGAVETYQRRYLWITAMEIVEHDALDAINGSDSGLPEKGLSPGTIKSTLKSLEDSETMEDLKASFGAAWKSASESQQAALKEKYESVKSIIEGKK